MEAAQFVGVRQGRAALRRQGLLGVAPQRALARTQPAAGRAKPRALPSRYCGRISAS